MITFTEAAGMTRQGLSLAFEELLRHTEEDALDRGELMTLSAVAWALANQTENRNVLPRS